MGRQTLCDILSGERFSVSYILFGEEKTARLTAKDICYEQTVEFPEDLTPAGPIANQIVGRIEDFARADEQGFRAVISYAVESAEGSVVQLLNVVFGNMSMKPGIKVERINFPQRVISAFRGPRFGRDGLRALLGVASRPLVVPPLSRWVFQPRSLQIRRTGLPSAALTSLRMITASATRHSAPFEKRVALCAESVARASNRLGRKSFTCQT